MEKQIKEYKGLPIFSLTIDDIGDPTAGIQAISLVENDAMQVGRLIMLGEEQKPTQLFFSTEDKQLITGVVIVKDKLIYRANPERWVVFTEENILALVQKYADENKLNRVNLSHTDSFTPATMVESFISREDNYLGFEDVPAGSWYVTMKIYDKKVWQDIKDGVYKGFSLEGFLTQILGFKEEQKQPELTEEQQADKLIDLSLEFLAELAKQVKGLE